MKKTVFSALILGALSLALVGCNTMHGLGQDIEAGGKGLSNAAGDHSSSNDQSNGKGK